MANAPMMHALLSCERCRRRRGARCVAGRTRPQRTARAPPRAQRPIGRRPGGACCGRSSTSPPRRRCGPPSTSRTRGAPPRCGRCASRCPPASCSTCRRCGGTPSRSAQTGRASQRSQSTTGMSLKDRRRREQEKNSFFFLNSKTFFESFRASLLIAAKRFFVPVLGERDFSSVLVLAGRADTNVCHCQLMWRGARAKTRRGTCSAHVSETHGVVFCVNT